MTSNDYGLGLYNGDTGVVVEDERRSQRSPRSSREVEVLTVSPSRLEAVETVYAMTVHKSQGSQFDTVALLLPGPDSPILTRELLYTAVTRADQPGHRRRLRRIRTYRRGPSDRAVLGFAAPAMGRLSGAVNGGRRSDSDPVDARLDLLREGRLGGQSRAPISRF